MSSCTHFFAAVCEYIFHVVCVSRLNKQNVALTGRNTTGPPWSVGRPPAGSVTDDDRRQRAKQYWSIRRASHKVM